MGEILSSHQESRLSEAEWLAQIEQDAQKKEAYENLKLVMSGNNPLDLNPDTLDKVREGAEYFLENPDENANHIIENYLQAAEGLKLIDRSGDDAEAA